MAKTELMDNKRPFKIAIDFDGTIVEHAFPDIGTPVPDALMWIQALKEAGATLILYTMRSDDQHYGDMLTAAIAFCRKRGVEFDSVNKDAEQEEWTASPKAYAHVYVDDAALGCPLIESPRFAGRPMVDWAKAGPKLMAMLMQHKNEAIS